MAYTRNPTWQSHEAGGTKITAAALNAIEDGLVAAAQAADTALSVAQSGVPGPQGPGAEQAGGLAGPSVQGLYSRTKPSPAGAPSGLYALAKDPTVVGRVWVQGLDFAQLGFTDDGGATWSARLDTVALGATGAIHQILFTPTHMWMVSGSNADRNGKVWRSPLPDASGNGISFTLMFNLASPPGGLTAGVNSCFRPQCLAVNGVNVYLLEYSIAAGVTGGPSVYYSGDSGATWSKPKTWANAKHGHAIKIINGGPVVMLGDSGTAFTDIGLHRATAVNGTGAWIQISQYGEAKGGNTLYGINFQPVTVNGKSMLAVEYDGALNYGPLLFPDTGGTTTIWPLLKTFELPPAYFGTMRCLTLTSEGNLMWVQTAENGAFGPNDTIWISKAPYTSAVLLDTFPTSTMFLGDPIEVGDYVWFGWFLCRKEVFV